MMPKLLYVPVTPFAGYDTSYPATGVFCIPFPARNEMDVGMHDRLAGGYPAVDTNVEASYRGILTGDFIPQMSDQALHILYFL